jgi:RNA 2',3'-cyclic 3'-phosphodiesterase
VASPVSKARLFVALDLPAGARAELVEWRQALEHPDVRLVSPEALHVTLVFLGQLAEAEIPRIAKLIAPPPVDSPLLTALGIKPLPPRRPRLFALDLSDEGGRATLIQSTVSNALAAAGLYEPEQRAFWPHVTLARVRKGARVGSIEVPPPPRDSWRAEAGTLYRSRLSSRGARYEPLERVLLA